MSKYRANVSAPLQSDLDNLVMPRGFYERDHPTHRHPEQVAGGDHGRQGPLVAPAAFQQPVEGLPVATPLGSRRTEAMSH